MNLRVNLPFERNYAKEARANEARATLLGQKLSNRSYPKTINMDVIDPREFPSINQASITDGSFKR